MADAFIGEIRIFCGNFIPKGWAACDGATMQIQQNPALYAIINTRYGGKVDKDKQANTTFMLPNLKGRAPLHQGSGVALTHKALAATGGVASVTLTDSTMPGHTHGAMAHNADGDVQSPSNALWAQNVNDGRDPIVQPQYTAAVNTAIDTAMAPTLLEHAGGSQPHNNMQPYLPLQFMICLEGIYPMQP